MKSNVRIDTFQRNGITYLKESFASNPFKLMDVREDKTQPHLQLMLMSASPGILDGDDYTFEIEVRDNCGLEISTQSFQRIFDMKASAIQKMNVVVGKNGFFRFLPHPAVPHKNSNFYAQNEIHLEDGAQLIWCDIFSCGRKLNGEAFEYTSFENCTTIYRDNKPVIIEHILFQPNILIPTVLGQLETFSHSGSLFVISEKMNVKALKQKADNWLETFSDIEFGSSESPINGLIIKILANGAEHLFQIVKQLVVDLQLELK
jgi:urease accessory protein